MKPGETRAMTVVFYIDPALADDPDGQGDLTMTLSYTFYPQREPQRPVAQPVQHRRANLGERNSEDRYRFSEGIMLQR